MNYKKNANNTDNARNARNANNANNANNAKVYTAKMTYRSFRKISEKFGRGEGGFLMKKGY